MFFFCLIFCGLIFGTDYSNNDSVEGDDAIFIYFFYSFGLIFCGLIFGTCYSDNGGHAEGDDALPMQGLQQ